MTPLQPRRQRKSSLKRLNFETNEDCREEDGSSNGTKSVQFSTIEIRDYSLCPGDHPDVNRGAPLSLDWEYQSEISFDLEEYEQSVGKIKKTHNDMIRMAFEREYMLQKWGYSKEEIKTCSKSVKKDRKNRSQTRRTLIFEPFLIMSEETKRWMAKRKNLKNHKVDNETKNRSIRTSSQDSITTTSTAASESCSYMANEIMEYKQ